jgi:thiamine-phosphate pyrophosphorylase
MDLPPLHVITDDAMLARPRFEHDARGLIEAAGPGVALHVRGPATAGAALWRVTSALAPAAVAAGSWLVVNDRVDVAATAAAHGVQLGRRSLPVAVARKLAGDRLRIGASVHDPTEADEAEGADWLLAGTVYASASHPGRAPAGPELIARLAGGARPPVVAIGGVRAERIAELRAAGAAGVAALSAVWGDDDPARAVAALLDAWTRAGAMPGGAA